MDKAKSAWSLACGAQCSRTGRAGLTEARKGKGRGQAGAPKSAAVQRRVIVTPFASRSESIHPFHVLGAAPPLAAQSKTDPIIGHKIFLFLPNFQKFQPEVFKQTSGLSGSTSTFPSR